MAEDPHSRDTALARLMTEALKSSAKSAGGAAASACPDADVLAAYTENGLTEEEKASCESHFANCSRCQKIIAVLAATGEELADVEITKLGNLAGALSAAREPAARDARWWKLWRRPAPWRWLVPAAGLASAAGLWLALHRAPSGEILISQKTETAAKTPPNEAAPESANPSAKPDESQIAQANLPPPPAPSAGSGVLLRDRETPAAKSSAVAPKEEAKKQEPFSSARQVPPVSPQSPTGNLESRADAAKDDRLQSSDATDQKSAAANALDAVAPAAPKASPPPLPSARDFDRAERQGLDGAAGAPAATQLKALAQAVSPTIVFASPNRRALWRLGPAGRIERSSDQGQSWQPQSSGVTADLLAGAAPSETVAWVVGRFETILRTADGEHWQRVPLPSAAEPASSANPAFDWTGVEARDALHATIVSRDLRRFTTEDGGRTWTQVP